MSRNDLDRREKTYALLAKVYGDDRARKMMLSSASDAYKAVETLGYYWDRDSAQWKIKVGHAHANRAPSYEYATITILCAPDEVSRIVETWSALSELDGYTLSQPARTDASEYAGAVRLTMRFKREVRNA